MAVRIKAVLTNRTTTIDWTISQALRDKLRDMFSFRPNGYQFMPLYKRGVWDGYIHLYRRNTIATGLFLAMKAEVEKELGVQFLLESRLVAPKFSPELRLQDSTRDYQEECVQKMIETAKKGLGGLILSATGTGKTLTAGVFFKNLIGSAVFVVDELTLLEQSKLELERVTGEPVGWMGKSEFEPQRITVATVQTLHIHRNKPRFRDWAQSLQVMLIDEIHTMLNKRQEKVVDAFRPLVVFGLTATLQLKQKPIRFSAFALTGPVIFEYGLKRGTDEGWLTRGIVVQVEVPFAWGRTEHWTETYRKCVINSEFRNDIITAIVRRALAEGRSVVLLVEWIDHLKLLSELLSDIPHRLVYGAVLSEDRIKAKAGFDRKEIRLLIANKVFTKGVDIKTVDCIIDAAARKSKTDCVQKFGRGVRLAEGKTGLVYFDIADMDNRFEKASLSRRAGFLAAKIKVFKVTDSSGNIIGLVKRAVEIAYRKPGELSDEKAIAKSTGKPSGRNPETRPAPLEAFMESMEKAPTKVTKLD